MATRHTRRDRKPRERELDKLTSVVDVGAVGQGCVAKISIRPHVKEAWKQACFSHGSPEHETTRTVSALPPLLCHSSALALPYRPNLGHLAASPVYIPLQPARQSDNGQQPRRYGTPLVRNRDLSPQRYGQLWRSSHANGSHQASSATQDPFRSTRPSRSPQPP
jgi:hypothetical protein